MERIEFKVSHRALPIRLSSESGAIRQHPKTHCGLVSGLRTLSRDSRISNDIVSEQRLVAVAAAAAFEGGLWGWKTCKLDPLANFTV